MAIIKNQYKFKVDGKLIFGVTALRKYCHVSHAMVAARLKLGDSHFNLKKYSVKVIARKDDQAELNEFRPTKKIYGNLELTYNYKKELIHTRSLTEAELINQ